MGLSEEQVFAILTQELDSRGFQFFVHCRYDSILQKYERHSIVIANSIPDILGIAPDDSVVGIEVKGDDEINRGIGQASSLRAGTNMSFLAADASELSRYHSQTRASTIGSIGVTEGGIEWWEEPNELENKSSLQDVRAQLTARLSGTEHISKIASLNLAHPANFLLPPLFLANSGYQQSLSRDAFTDQFESAIHLEGTATHHAIEGSTVLGLIESSPDSVQITDHGRLAVRILHGEDVSTIDQLERFIKETSQSTTIHRVAPLLAIWLLDQYRKHPDFEALFRTLQSFEPGTPILLTELSKRFIRDHPNAFLRLFCTKDDKSRPRARQLILRGESHKLHENLDMFRHVIRQNLLQNFARQLQHLGVLSSETSSTTTRLEEYHPESYPWVTRPKGRNARLFQL